MILRKWSSSAYSKRIIIFDFPSHIQKMYIAFVIRFTPLLKTISSLKETMTAVKKEQTTRDETTRKRVNSSFSIIYFQSPSVEVKCGDRVQSLETTYFFIGEETSDASIYFLDRKRVEC